MKLITEQTIVQSEVESWLRCYNRDGRPEHKATVASQLEALDLATATSEQFAQITGREPRYAPQPDYCNECHTQKWRLVELGDEPDYNSRTASVCADCLRAALRLLGVEP